MTPSAALGPRQRWPKINAQLLLIVLMGSVLSALAAWRTYDESRADTRAQLSRTADQVRDEIKRRFETMMGGLTALNHVYSLNPNLSRQDFASVISEMEVNFKQQGVKTLGLIQRAGQRDQPTPSAALLSGGKRLIAPHALPVQDLGEFYVVKFIKSTQSGSSAAALDADAIAKLRPAFMLAVDKASSTMTNTPVAAATSNAQDFVVFSPVYDRRLPRTTVAQRRSALLGVLFVRITPEQLLARVEDSLSPGSDVELFDNSHNGMGSNLLYDADKHRSNNALNPKREPGAYFQASQTLTLFDQPLLVFIRTPKPSAASLPSLLPWLVALTGVLITLLLARIYWRWLLVHRQSAQKIDEVQAELSEKDNLVAGIFEMSPLAISLCDLSGNFISCNPAFERLLGYSPEEAKSLNYWKLSPELDNWVEARQLLSKASHFGPREKEFLHKDGHLLPVSLNGMRLLGANNTQYICFLIEDITERKQTLKELGQSQAFNLCVLDSLSANIAVLDDRGVILQVNEAWRRFGKENGASNALCHPIGYKYIDAFKPVSGTLDSVSIEMLNGLQSVLANQQRHFEIDYPCDSPTQKRWFHMTVTHLLAPGRGVVVSHTDISRAKQSQVDQQSAENLLRNAIETIGEAFALFDADDRLVLCNQQYRDLFPWCADMMLPGNTFEQIIRVGARRGQFEEAIGQVEEWVAQRVAIHRQPASDLVQRLTDGKILRIIERQTADGYTVGVRSDITELVHATEAANQATRAKSEFLATMSHEIRTPMNAVFGLLQLLALTEMSAQQSEYVHQTRQAAQSMLQLLNDILDFSRLESDKTTLELQTFALDDLLQELSILLSTQRANKPLELLFDIAPETPKVLIGDVLRLKQILFNLGNNAVKFTDQGEVLVQIRVLTHSATSAVLCISVLDTGIGIAPEFQQTIFSPFSQAESSITRRFGGTGLGLSITKKLVDLMAGQIELASVPGQGSTFSVTLTLQLPLESVQASEAVSKTGTAALPLLLIEDHPMARQLEQAMAHALGWQTDVASNCAQALAMIRSRALAGQAAYSVILLDEDMPDANGWECSRRLRAAFASGSGSAIIMLASQPRQALAKRDESELALLDAYLIKPITAGMLSQALQNARNGKRTVRNQRRQPSAKPARLQDMRLLVVEDNSLNQRVMQELLRSEGARVELADNGALAIAAIVAAKPPFDAVLMDLQMPVMDGFGATRVIRSELGLAALPVIALSANNSLSDRQSCLAAGMNDHVGKPFDMAHLVGVLLKHSGHATSAQAEPIAPVATPETHDNPAILDENVLQSLAGNPAMLRDLLRSFQDELTRLPEQLDALLAKGDFTGAAQLVHTQIGISAIVGAKHLARVARQVETSLKDGAQRANHQTFSAELRQAIVLTSQALQPQLEKLSQAAVLTP